jgi:hypothetical protein
MKPHVPLLLIIATLWLPNTCSANGADLLAQAVTPIASTPSIQGPGPKMDDLKAFATNDTKILDSKTGDLNGDGAPDALLVLDPPTRGSEKLGEGPPRTVLLLVRNASGTLQQATQNNKIVPCAQCGGIAGDPFGYIRLKSNGFTIVNGGGDREHWTNEYTFTYSSASRNWLLDHVLLRVVDKENGREKHRELTAKDLGAIKFQDFDPSTLPEVELP